MYSMEVECVYEKGVLKPLKKIKMKEKERIRIMVLEDKKSVIKEAFGLLKGKDTLKSLNELEDDWGFH